MGFLLVLAFGGMVTLTLLPDTRFPFADNVRYGVQECKMTGGPRPFSELLLMTQSSLNVALSVPLGFAVGWVGSLRRAVVVGLGALALLFLVEVVQYELPVLGRACDVQDIWDSLFGLVIGVALGLLTGPPGRLLVRRRLRA
ncbi:VanZ family protein [Saccharothrix sp. ST-888]|uniref:VanZ family protein n=1 Tax=Saccharothrix sp. ST-888 TaxID=1427391 RepID=UPI0005EC160E|nr:VanZ family protein [Saccharothrix sp. ST-888]KJK56641.1 hypothetical protein UK12_21345 [Saccharothrix sp. ST-888]